MVLRGEGCGHLRDGLAGEGMGPVGGHIQQGDEDEGAVLQAGVGQDQTVRGFAALERGVEVALVGLRGGIGQDGLAEGEKVEVERAHAPAGFAGAAMRGLDPVEEGEDVLRAETGGKGRGGGGVHIIGTGPCRKAGRGVYSAWLQGAEPCGGEIGKCGTERFEGRTARVGHVPAEGDQKP